MDHSCGKGSRLRRVLPVGLVGVGACAVAAYVSAMFAGTPTSLITHPVASGDQSVTAMEPAQTQAPTQAPVTLPVESLPGAAQAEPATRAVPDAALPAHHVTDVARSAAPAAGSLPAAPSTAGLPGIPSLPTTTLGNLPLTALDNVPTTSVASLPAVSPSAVSDAAGRARSATAAVPAVPATPADAAAAGAHSLPAGTVPGLPGLAGIGLPGSVNGISLPVAQGLLPG